MEMFKIKDVRDGAVLVTALATAYGLGILSCVYWELSVFADLYKTSKLDSLKKDEEES
jgi:hypothetical protein